MPTGSIGPVIQSSKSSPRPGVLAQWRHRGVGPPYVKLSNRILYRGADLNQFLAERTVQPTAA